MAAYSRMLGQAASCGDTNKEAPDATEVVGGLQPAGSVYILGRCGFTY